MWDLRSSNSHFVYFSVLSSCITSTECDCSRARTCVCVCAMSVCLLEMSSCVLILCELLCTRLTIHWTNVMCLYLCVCVLYCIARCIVLCSLACLIIEWIQNEFEMLRTDHLRWVLDCCTWHSDTQLAYNCVCGNLKISEHKTNLDWPVSCIQHSKLCARIFELTNVCYVVFAIAWYSFRQLLHILIGQKTRKRCEIIGDLMLKTFFTYFRYKTSSIEMNDEFLSN